MASTNKTTNYELSQFLGTDKPAWLSDYNTDMSKIDAQMKLNSDAATAAQGDATAAGTAIGTLANLTTDAKTNAVAAINEVDLHADTAQNTANEASVDAGAALVKATALEDALNLTADTPITSGIVSTGSVSATVSECRVTIAKNSVGSLCKVYGYINLANTASSGACVLKITDDSGLRPETDFEVEGVCFKSTSDGISQARLVFKTTGEIDCTFNKTANITQDIRLMACVIFVKSFGD